MTRALISALLLVALLAPAASSWATMPSSAARVEIDHLLSYVEKSGCKFDRNDTWHDSHEAGAHLAKKERYLEDRGQIATAEDFIAKTATKSSMTGKPYMVRCGSGPAVAAAGWLTAELQRFRQGR